MVDSIRVQLEQGPSLPGADTDLVEGGWPAAYGARRIAWHVLDHAWEIEDKAQ